MSTEREKENQQKIDLIKIKCPRCSKPHAMELWDENETEFVWACDYCGWEYYEPRISFVYGE